MSDAVSNNFPFAYSFLCDLTRKEIQAQLSAVGPWTWVGGDSEYDGLYLRAVPGPGAKLRIIGETPPDYIIEIDLNPALAEGLTLAELHRAVIDDLLPSIGATNVTNAS
jgi:hypothetical protein